VANPRACAGSVVEQEMTLPTQTEDDARKRAEASFKKEERAKDGAEAMIEYLANNRATREKTERLKALRLAKENAAADQATKPA
jgi:hypothetical protein